MCDQHTDGRQLQRGVSDTFFSFFVFLQSPTNEGAGERQNGLDTRKHGEQQSPTSLCFFALTPLLYYYLHLNVFSSSETVRKKDLVTLAVER